MDNFITEMDVRARLGISQSTLQRFRKDKVDPIPHFRKGRIIRYSWEEVRKWLERQTRRQVGDSQLG